MKKNAMLKIAAVLLVAVLLTTCAISSTFAKYVEDIDDYKASARVAAWGVEAKTTISGDLFDKEYQQTGAAGNTGTVKANTDVMAPGTQGSVEVVTVITGSPEVSGEIKYEAKVEVSEAIEKNYKLLNFKLNGNDVTVAQGSSLEATIAKAITDLSQTFEPGKLGGDEGNITKSFTLSWEWPYYVNADGDIADTALGDAAAKGTDTSISIEIKASIYQTNSGDNAATETENPN